MRARLLRRIRRIAEFASCPAVPKPSAVSRTLRSDLVTHTSVLRVFSLWCCGVLPIKCSVRPSVHVSEMLSHRKRDVQPCHCHASTSAMPVPVEQELQIWRKMNCANVWRPCVCIGHRPETLRNISMLDVIYVHISRDSFWLLCIVLFFVVVLVCFFNTTIMFMTG